MDIVTNHVDDLIKRIKELPAVRGKVLYVYDQETLLNDKAKLGFPALGVVYVGLKGQSDSSRTGLASDLICDIYLIGADACRSNAITADEKPKATKLLDDIRSAIKCTETPSKRKWEFVFESPIDLGDNLLSYVQRWKTRVLLTN